MSRTFYDVDSKKLTVTGNYYVIFDDSDFKLHFKPNEDDELVPSHVTGTRKAFKDGTTVTVVTTSNGYVLKNGKETSIHDSVYGLQTSLAEATMMDIPLRKEFSEVAEHLETYDEFELLCTKLNAAYQESK